MQNFSSSGHREIFTVLLIDDQPIVAEAVKRLIAGEVWLKYCSDPTKALDVAVETSPTVILLDLVMPDIDGLMLIKFIRAHPKLSKIPIILLSTRDDPEDKARAFEGGANDYLIKLPHRVELMARLRYHSQAYVRLMQRDQALKALRDSQKQLEENNLQLQTLNRELAEANRARSQFLAKMSHEIRTPINGILGVIQLLKRTPMLPRQEEYANIISSSGELLLSLINDILDFSKMEAGKLVLEKVDFDLEALLDEILQLLAVPAHKKSLELLGLVGPGVPTHVRGDPTRIRQILLNLVGNAVKFTTRGQVRVDISLVSESDGEVRLTLAVRDSGMGITQEQQTRLFQAFAQADSSTTRRHGGTGLGLAIVRHLCEQMNGSITLNSEVGEGSVFTAEVCLEKAAQQSSTVEAGMAQQVMVIDDSLGSRQALDYLLADWVPARVCLTAAEACLRPSPLFEIVFIDSKVVDLHPWSQLFPGATQVRLLPLGEEGPEHALVLSKPIKRSELAKILKFRSPDRALPVTLGPAHQPGPVLQLPQGLPLLLVEDNLINQTIAMEVFESLGYLVDLAENGLEAVEMSAKTDYAVIVMDCEMPEMDGYQATAAIRQREGDRCHTPIIAMTAYAMEGDRQKCLQAGMDDYVTKPFDLDRVGVVVERWLRRPGPSSS